MLLRVSSSSRRLGLAAALSLLVSAGAARAQTVLPADGMDKLNQAFLKAKRDLVDKVAAGSEDAKENAEDVKLAARWYTYQVTWRDLEAENKMQGHLFAFDKLLGIASKDKEKGKPFLDIFAPEVVSCAKEVLDADGIRKLAQVNVVRLLGLVAAHGREEPIDQLLRVLADEKLTDGARYYAVQGLRDFLKLGHQDKPVLMDKEREKKCVLALLQLLKRPAPPKDTPQAEVDGFRMFRRQVIVALGWSRHPALPGEKGGRTALELLRVVRKAGVQPEPRLEEQIDAAIGVARMKPGLFPDFQADYAAYQIAQFVFDFAETARADAPEPQKKVYSYHAARLGEALLALKNDKDLKAQAQTAEYVGQMVDACVNVLKDLESKGTIEALQGLLENKKPAAQTLYKGMADSAVEPGKAELEAKPDK